MILPLRNKRIISLILILVPLLLAIACLALVLRPTVWTTWDNQLLDAYFRYAVQRQQGPELSPDIVYAMITDPPSSTSNERILDRSAMAEVNAIFMAHGAAAVAYDIIYSRPSHPAKDDRFAQSLEQSETLYLPLALDYTSHQRAFTWETGTAYNRLRTDYIKVPQQVGIAHPLYATRAVMQLDSIVNAVPYTGHISASSDTDGVYRHIPTLLKIGSGYVPTLSLAIFLDHIDVPLQALQVDWGHDITIRATPQNDLDADVVIPIDHHGRAFIPYAQVWDHDFDKITIHNLLKYQQDPDLQGNLTELIEDRFVFIGDASIGTSDIGHTPLEANTPLVTVHAAFLNGLLTNSFYRSWSHGHVLMVLLGLSILLTLAALPRSSWILYATGGLIVVGIFTLTGWQFTHFYRVPVLTITLSFMWIFFGLVIGLQIAIAKDRTFIRQAFAKYVPEKVVSELLAQPERLQLGGEVRTLSILFSDIEGFTTISETMEPEALGQLLNEYLSAMTEIVLTHNGIIDKYEGDAIMAEFGAPLPLPDHADMAVQASLEMQYQLDALRLKWAAEGLPELRCRVGINTGSVVLGNMGSRQVFDYTVIGDAVNLASRLEGANKAYQTYIMISESTHECLTPNRFRTRLLDVVKVQGKTTAVKVFEVYGYDSDDIDATDLSYYNTYQQAFHAYLDQQFTDALDGFRKALVLRPHDLASRNMLLRIETLDHQVLSPDWDGSTSLTSK